MPWKDTGPVDQRMACLVDWQRDEWTICELAQRYGVAPKTVHKWVGRFAIEGPPGLLDRSRAPHAPARATDAAVIAAVLALRQAHPTWGPKKLQAVLRTREPARAWPAASTIGDLLRRANLSHPRRRRRVVSSLTPPLTVAEAPNDVWSADFKGWFRTTNGTRCDPLTVIDACSRYVLCCQIVPPTGAGVRPWFARTFQTYGLPRALRTDNGPPFASTGAARLSRLAVWWLKLGIQLDRIDPGHPEQNGRHERFHRTLHEETSAPPAATPRAQQARFDQLRVTFNDVRPHEALGQQPPARAYTPSPRPYPSRVPEPWYDATYQVRRVRTTGAIKWQGDVVFLSEALCGEPVGLKETAQGDWSVHFLHVELGRIARRTQIFTPVWPGRRRARSLNKVLPMCPV
jgi:putative transposase